MNMKQFQVFFVLWVQSNSKQVASSFFYSFVFQRAAASERQTEQLRQQLITVHQSQSEGDNPHKATADMDKAIDMLQRSSLEVELAAKEKEVNILPF